MKTYPFALNATKVAGMETTKPRSDSKKYLCTFPETASDDMPRQAQTWGAPQRISLIRSSSNDLMSFQFHMRDAIHSRHDARLPNCRLGEDVQPQRHHAI